MSQLAIPKAFGDLLDSGDYVLFAGAGVGVEAGIPAWGLALANLAQRLAATAPHHAGLMFEEAKQRRYVEAAELLYLAPISAANRASLLQAVFGATPTLTRRLKLLVSTPCRAIVTTNFDRSLDLAATQTRTDLVRYTESPSDLAYARVATAPYILRLHGRVEVPDSLVFAHRHFAALPDNEPYVEFFRHLFLNTNVIFFGFSFTDPILTSLLHRMTKAVRSVFRRKAVALLPEPLSADIVRALREANIDVLAYPPADDHAAAWDLITERRPRASMPRADLYETETLKSHLASVYARVRARGFSADRASVLSGLMVPVLLGFRRADKIALEEFFGAVESTLALPTTVGRQVLVDALKLLAQDGIVSIQGEELQVRVVPPVDALEADANRLLEGVLSRSQIRFRIALPDVLRVRVRDAIVFALSLDGLHLAYSVIKRAPLDRLRLHAILELALEHAGITEGRVRTPILAALEALMMQPDREEERVLANVSVVVFATALLLNDPAAARDAGRLVERGAFVDASVLLPWICEGHPLQRSYAATLNAFGPRRIHVMDGYLNELVSHRRLAVEAMDGGLRDDQFLRRYVGLFELHNINTFVGGFAATKAAGFRGQFADYLTEYAPFETDGAAGRFLEQKGLVIEESPARGPLSLFSELRSALRDMGRRREDVVIEHDARQLEVMASPRGTDLIFITADRALLAAVSTTGSAAVIRRMFLPHQAAYLSQFAAKGRSGFEGIVRAMWSQGDAVAAKVKRFYTDRILREYDYALVSEIPAVVDAMLKELEKAGIDLESEFERGEGETERLRIFTALDRFEPEFYEKLAEAKKRAGAVESA